MDGLTKTAKILWDYLHIGKSVNQSDCIIGLGSYDLRVADRCVELLNKGMGEYIIFSGGEGNWTRGLWNKPEAEVFKTRAIELGVAKEKVFVEDKSTNIGENIRFSRKLIKTTGIKAEKVLFVTKPQTERRVYATVPIDWPEVSFSVTSPNISFENQPIQNHTIEDLINEMVGDVQRIMVYSEKGIQIPQDVPEQVTDAFQKLIDMGFNKHLIK